MPNIMEEIRQVRAKIDNLSSVLHDRPPWQNVEIVASALTTGAIDLGKEYDYIQIALPTAWTACTLRLQVSDVDESGAWYNLGGATLVTEATAASDCRVLICGGFRYVKIVCSVAQVAARSIRVRGFRK